METTEFLISENYVKISSNRYIFMNVITERKWQNLRLEKAASKDFVTNTAHSLHWFSLFLFSALFPSTLDRYNLVVSWTR